MVCFILHCWGTILSLSHLHIGYMFLKDFFLSPSFLLVPYANKTLGTGQVKKVDCSEACLYPTIYPQRGTLGICKCIPQRNSLKFFLIHLFPQPLSSGLKKNKKNSPVSASHSSPPRPTPPQRPHLLLSPHFRCLWHLAPLFSLLKVESGRNKRLSLFWSSPWNSG